MKILIIGANGQLGTDLSSHFATKHELIPLTEDHIEIADAESVKNAMSAHRPNVVINTAAFHNVPLCEENPVRAFEVNGLGALHLAKLSGELGFKLVHISTDYVFDGEKNAPYTETDRPHPLNVYANTKLAGEYFISAEAEDYIIARVSGIYGKTRCMAKGGNFINTMLRLYREGKSIRVVTDEILTPTSTVEISRQLELMIETKTHGLFHVTQEGACSWHEFAQAIFDILQLDVNVAETTTSEFVSPVKRPFYSVLENAALKKLGINIMKDWREALEEFLTQTPIEEL